MRLYIKVFLAILLITFCSACSSRTLDDFHDAGDGIIRDLTAELKQIRSRDDLPVHAPKLKKHFNALVELIIEAQKFKDAHPGENTLKKDPVISDQLRIELNRVIHMEGGREIIEQVQEESLNRLDAFLKNKV